MGNGFVNGCGGRAKGRNKRQCTESDETNKTPKITKVVNTQVYLERIGLQTPRHIWHAKAALILTARRTLNISSIVR
jgi:hypothetical protein